jgi:hypothetical protein
MLEGQFDHVALLLVANAELRTQLLAGRQRGHAVLLEQSVEKASVLLRNLLVELRRVEAAPIATDELRRQQQVDAVGLAVDLLLDPVELHAQGVEGVPRHAEHAETAGLRHGSRHIAAMGEGEDGKLESHVLGELGPHGILPLRGDAPRQRRVSASSTALRAHL